MHTHLRKAVKLHDLIRHQQMRCQGGKRQLQSWLEWRAAGGRGVHSNILVRALPWCPRTYTRDRMECGSGGAVNGLVFQVDQGIQQALHGVGVRSHMLLHARLWAGPNIATVDLGAGRDNITQLTSGIHTTRHHGGCISPVVARPHPRWALWLHVSWLSGPCQKWAWIGCISRAASGPYPK